LKSSDGREENAGGMTTPLSAACLVVGLALIEPAMARLEKFGDTLEAKQYLFIMPTGEVSYLVPAVRELSVPGAGLFGIGLLLAGLLPAVTRLRRRGLDFFSAAGWCLYALGAGLLAGEYMRVGVRYLSFTFLAIGAFLGSRSRRYLATLGMMGFTWDLSSAIFWAALKRDVTATVPVPWYHHFDQEEGRGAPCWAVAALDTSMLLFFAWLLRHDFDPLDFYDD
jgi:hypothetical protein